MTCLQAQNKIDCAGAYNNGKPYFDASGWPLPDYFGNDWHHVRRIAPNSQVPIPGVTQKLAPGWIVMKDKDGQFIMGDNLQGYGTGQSNTEAMVFKDKRSLSCPISVTRPYFLWDFDQYLIATGKIFVLLLTN